MRAKLSHGIAMRTIKANRLEILKAVVSNREKHVVDFKEAMSGFQILLEKKAADAIASLEQQKKEIVAGERTEIVMPVTALRKPVSHEKDYNQVIKMLEMETSEIIDVKSDEFACYVMDDWDWKEDFEVSNTLYKSFTANP